MTLAPPREAFAAAKVNLFLHVGARKADGYHPIASLIVFADVGDRLTVESASGPASLRTEGPFAAGLPRDDENLVLRACGMLAPDGGVRFVLDKQLPLAAGLGGGSADAAATLRLLNARLAKPLARREFLSAAQALGADTAACLGSEPVVATGRGDRLTPAPKFPALDGVLVNPGVASLTGGVYRALDEQGRAKAADLPGLHDRYDAEQIASLVRETRNDLEEPAIGLEPAIGEALAALNRQPETLAARMTGSGATVFSLCANAAEAARLAARLASTRRDWWVRACRLGSGPK
jgi:4-diphosphocytidyl-2-C-methyl-D-erythritol kinase